MPASVLATKLYIPLPRAKTVPRSRLIERLNEGLTGKLTLISAPAGFGKTTLISEWVHGCHLPAAWLSLDEGDSDPARFIAYLISALQMIKAGIGEGLLGALQSPQPLQTESLLTALLNEITTIPDNFILVLDDYHVIDSKPVDETFSFLLDHLPPQMHLVITTREDPSLALPRYRARGQLTELRAADLRFTFAEAADFLNRVMGLPLSAEDIAALESRTEGWIAGLQLAAISMQGHQGTSDFFKSFTGSHHFVLDYLIEEVLHQQPENVQAFLLQTSILDQMCGPLCDAVLASASASGQLTLEYLERANLFIVPLDNERCWYRYHHLFRDLLRQRLRQNESSGNGECIAEYHIRASQWYEENGYELEAFQHATAANDIDRATRLMEGNGIPMHSPHAVTTMLNWLASLPKRVLDDNPLLWLRYASMALVKVQTADVEERLQGAEVALAAVLHGTEPDDYARNMIGQIAAARATLILLTQTNAEGIIYQSQRALAYLSSDNLDSRFTAIWAQGVAYQLKGDRAAAERAHTEALSICQKSGNHFHRACALNSLGHVQESENLLYQAADSYQHVLDLFGDYPQPSASETYLGLARICYQWNDLDTAEQYGQKSLNLARQYDRTIDRFILSEVFLARLKLTRSDVSGAAAILAQAEQSVRQNNFVKRVPDVADAQVLVLLHQGDLAAAADLAQTHKLPFSQARVYLAQRDASAALAVLEPLRQKMEAKGWADELLKVMVLQVVALQAHGEKDRAVKILADALALAEPGGFIRIFVDEGEAMRSLLRMLIEKQSRNRDHLLSDYVDKLLADFTQPMAAPKSALPGRAGMIIQQKSEMIEPAPLVEALSERELEVLKLLRSELAGPEIAQQLSVSINTFRTHTKNIFNKLGVNDRRAAIRRAEELNLF
jgi:LuxR family transcriptional regulator, maltose regulon positive regulatory protein